MHDYLFKNSIIASSIALLLAGCSSCAGTSTSLFHVANLNNWHKRKILIAIIGVTQAIPTVIALFFHYIGFNYLYTMQYILLMALIIIAIMQYFKPGQLIV